MTSLPISHTPPTPSPTARLTASPAEEQRTAARTWAALAPQLAARGRVRISRDGGRNYPRRYERAVTTNLPSQPAAVLVYDDHGCAPVLVVDLDTAKAPAGSVERDYAALLELLARAGLESWFSDRSPNGGRHVYVPLAEPVPFTEAATAVRALAQRLPSVDPLPMLGIASGCIRPPGARHKSGGHQVLDGTLAAATHALQTPNDTHAWARFLTELQRHRGPLVTTSMQPRHHDPADARENPDNPGTSDTALSPLPGHHAPSERYQEIARTGHYDPARYASPSEARQGVIWAAVASGWTLADVARRLADGTWPGLASFYARYAPRTRHAALARDWHQAHHFEKARRQAHSKQSVRVRTTSTLKSHRGVPPRPSTRPSAPTAASGRVNSWIREWLTAVDLLHGTGTDLALRAVLYALAEAAALRDSVFVEHGNRSLAIATGLHHTTVGRALLALQNEPADRCLLTLVQPAHGVYAHVFELRIPALLRPACAAAPRRPGRVHAIRPAFRELGLSAAFTYAALEQYHHHHQRSPITGRDLARLARLSVTATAEALHALATHGLADRTTAGWTLGTASLTHLAEAWGIAAAVRDQIEHYRSERAVWRAWLADHGLLDPTRVAAPAHGTGQSAQAPLAHLPPPEPPPRSENLSGLLTLLENELGAQLVDERDAS